MDVQSPRSYPTPATVTMMPSQRRRGFGGGSRRPLNRGKSLVLLALGSAALAPHPAAAIWPFDGDSLGEGGGDGGEGPKGFNFGDFGGPQMAMPPGMVMVRGGMPQGMMPPGMMMAGGGGPRVVFGGMPVMVVRGHFGFDPFEDLHSNLERVIQQSHQPALPGGGGVVAQPRSLEAQLGSLMGAFGDQHAGHFGRADGSFEVDDDHETRIRITALLPGYNLGDAHEAHFASESPLSVRAVGHRSLVVKGMQQSGHLIRSWQRSFALPKGIDIDHIAVTYNSKSGNLTVDVPRRNGTDLHAEDEQDEDDDEDDDDMMLPPVLRAMKQGLPGILSQLAGANHGPIRVTQLGGPSLRGGGFLMPSSMGGDPNDILAQILGQVGGMHPRYHGPAGGDKPPPEEAEINFLGCFAESQLEKVELKYYGEGNAGSFNAMYWHATGDHVPYFAMARHGEPLGHAFTAHGFVHSDEKPKWGIYDGCGTRCQDDPNRWCGCSHEGSRGFPNPECMDNENEKRFAVYKIAEAPPSAALAPENATQPLDAAAAATEGGDAVAAEAATAAVAASTTMAVEAGSAAGRPYWQLSPDNGEGSPSIEIMVPKGQVAKAKGRQVLLYNATDAEAGAGADASTSTGPGAAAAAGEVQAHGAAAGGASAASVSPSAAPVGKMRLPVGVSEESCVLDGSRVLEDGSQVLKCELAKNSVRQVPIKVIDEL